MGEFNVSTLQLCKSCIIRISIAGHRNKSNKNHYPSDDTKIVVDDSQYQHMKLVYHVVIMADSGLK